MGLSIRAYARHRGVSDAAVRKAIAAGRITPEADGTVDPERATPSGRATPKRRAVARGRSPCAWPSRPTPHLRATVRARCQRVARRCCKRNSKQRIDPLIEKSAALAELIAPARSRDSGNTILAKEFRKRPPTTPSSRRRALVRKRPPTTPCR